MKFKILLLILGFIIFPNFSNGEVVNHTTYIGYTQVPITIGWDPSVDAQYYKFEGFHYEQNITVFTGTTPETQITVTFPRSGHYILKVKACKIETDQVELCSIFAESTNPTFAVVDEQPKAWWVYKYIAPPGPIE